MPRTPAQRTRRAEGEEPRSSPPGGQTIMNRHGGAGDPAHTDPAHTDLGRPPTLPASGVVISADGPEPARGPKVENRARLMTMFRWGAYVSMGALAVFAAAAAVYTTRDVLVRVLIALFVAISLDPAVRMLTRRGMRRGLAVLLIFLIAGGLVAAFLVSVIPAMVHQFEALVKDFPGYLANLQERSARFRGLSDRFHLTSRIQDFLGNVPGQLGNGLLGFTRRLFGALFSTLTVVVLTIYFMADLPRLRHGVMRLFPHAHRAKSAGSPT